MSPLMAQSGHIEASVRLSAFGAKRTCALVWLRRPRPLMTGTVEKGFWGRSLSNIDSRSNATAQSRFKNPFVRIRLFQILIPQLHFGDFFNSIDPQPTKAPSKSRSAVGLPQCCLPLRSTGEIAGETARVHHASRRRRCCVASRGARAAD